MKIKKNASQVTIDGQVDNLAEQLAGIFIEQAKYNRQHKKRDDSPLGTYIEKIKLDISYTWEPVLAKDDQEYHYPMPISRYMKEHYNHSSIYRWDIYERLPEDKKQIYIGEAQILCPQRIQGYLTPGPSQQTNKRIKEKFQGFLKDGLKIKLEVLRLQRSFIGKVSLTTSELSNKYVRHCIEALLISNYQNKGYVTLNL